MKKFLSVICVLAILFSFAACGNDSETIVTGKVLSVNGNELTLMTGGRGRTDMSGGDMPQFAQMPDGGMPQGGEKPEMPDGGMPQGGEKPEMPDGGMPQGGEKPEKPDGGMPQGGEKPEMPEGGMFQNGEKPDMPQGGGRRKSGTDMAKPKTLTIDIENAVMTGTVEPGVTVEVRLDSTGKKALSVTVKEDSFGGAFGGAFGGTVEQGGYANIIDGDGSFEGKEYFSEGNDENALRVDGATVTLKSVTVGKNGGETSNAENGDFYGVNAALLATNGAQVTIDNATVTSAARNGNGVFSYGKGTVVNISDSRITTSADNSGGIQTTGGGTTNAKNLTIETGGSSSAAIRSDRGGGTVDVTGGSYKTTGLNSPAVYSTANITVRDAKLDAVDSEALVIEGKNSITLENCTVSGCMNSEKGSSSNINVHGIMIYQSMSGDADVGTSSLKIKGGSVTNQNGDVIFVTNTNCTVELSGVDFENNDKSGRFLTVTGNDASRGWGTAGANGGNAVVTADGQTIDGDTVVDTVSTLSLTLSNGSVLNGTINIKDNAEGGSPVKDNAVITIGEGCVWNLTGDCCVTSLTNNGTINFNGHIMTLADGTSLQ